MKTELKQDVNRIDALQKQVADLQSLLHESQQNFQDTLAQKEQALAQKEERIAQLTHQLYLFRNARFGRKSEQQVPDAQMRLFDETYREDDKDAQAETEKETITYTRHKKKTGRQKLPGHLPYVTRVYDLSEAEKQCPCGCALTPIGQDVSEQLDVLPQVTFRVVHIRKKYACPSCEDTVAVARLPAQPFPKCLATSGLVAAIIDAKFNRHCPLYRQEEMFQSMGLSLTRATLSHWVIKAARHLTPLVDVMTQHIRAYDIAYADETGLQVLNEPGRKATTKSYMWLFMGGPPDKRSIVYQYHPTRSHSVVKDFLADFKGYLHADCYRAYVDLDSPAIRHVACLAHARRYFMDIVKTINSKKGLAVDAIKQIARLYHIEQQLTQQQASPEERYSVRQQQAKPLLDDMKQWLAKHYPRVSPRAPIGKAIAYARKHWQALTRYLDDGRLEIDNNRSERAIKPFVIGRKNWLFHNNVTGAQAGSILFSLVQTCKEHHVDVFAYLKYALEHVIHCQTTQELEALLPFNCDKAQLDRQRDIPTLQFPDKADK